MKIQIYLREENLNGRGSPASKRPRKVFSWGQHSCGPGRYCLHNAGFAGTKDSRFRVTEACSRILKGSQSQTVYKELYFGTPFKDALRTYCVKLKVKSKLQWGLG